MDWRLLPDEHLEQAMRRANNRFGLDYIEAVEDIEDICPQLSAH